MRESCSTSKAATEIRVKNRISGYLDKVARPTEKYQEDQARAQIYDYVRDLQILSIT